MKKFGLAEVLTRVSQMRHRHYPLLRNLTFNQPRPSQVDGDVKLVKVSGSVQRGKPGANFMSPFRSKFTGKN
jgi:hypothetical protein